MPAAEWTFWPVSVQRTVPPCEIVTEAGEKPLSVTVTAAKFETVGVGATGAAPPPPPDGWLEPGLAAYVGGAARAVAVAAAANWGATWVASAASVSVVGAAYGGGFAPFAAGAPPACGAACELVPGTGALAGSGPPPVVAGWAEAPADPAGPGVAVGRLLITMGRLASASALPAASGQERQDSQPVQPNPTLERHGAQSNRANRLCGTPKDLRRLCCLATGQLVLACSGLGQLSYI